MQRKRRRIKKLAHYCYCFAAASAVCCCNCILHLKKSSIFNKIYVERIHLNSMLGFFPWTELTKNQQMQQEDPNRPMEKYIVNASIFDVFNLILHRNAISLHSIYFILFYFMVCECVFHNDENVEYELNLKIQFSIVFMCASLLVFFLVISTTFIDIAILRMTQKH